MPAHKKLHETVETFEILPGLTVSTISRISCIFLHGDIDDIGDIASIAILASAFFQNPSLPIVLYTWYIIQNVYNFNYSLYIP